MLATAKNKKLAKREKNLVLKTYIWTGLPVFYTAQFSHGYFLKVSFEAFLFLPSMAKTHPCFVN